MFGIGFVVVDLLVFGVGCVGVLGGGGDCFVVL